MKLTKGFLKLCLLMVISVALGVTCAILTEKKETESAATYTDVKREDLTLSAYTGEPYVTVNGNVPDFSEDDLSTTGFETYDALDSLGRTTGAYACLSTDTMPKKGETRESIEDVHPTGMVNQTYACVEQSFLYNRTHLIAWSLSGENANERNLVTGTRYMNLEMTEHETLVSGYITSTKHHVLYRVTPVYEGDELVCRGLLMEGQSVEDDEISFCVFYYNVQPGITIDYATGASEYTGEFPDTDSEAVIVTDEDAEEDNTSQSYILNTRSMRFHKPECTGAAAIKDKNRKDVTATREELIAQGYKPCGQCHP